MKVKANSVTFPDGSHEGMLVVSPVVTDRLPMTPPGGGSTFGQPAWTVQPSGTRFDPPIEVTMPNVGGMKPGDTAPVVQWDHDLAQYVPMGRATVTEDGAFLVTDPGTGISKAGWGGCTDCPPLPVPQKCAAPSPCDPSKCRVGNGNCGCKDSDNKCKDGVKITGTWTIPDGLFEGINQKFEKFSRVSPWFSITSDAKASGGVSAEFQDKCCSDAACAAPPKKYVTVSGTIGADAKMEAKIGPALIGRIEDAVARFGTQEKGGFVLSIKISEIRPSITAKFSGARVTVSGTSNKCSQASCISAAFNSSASLIGAWNPEISIGAYAPKDYFQPSIKPDGTLNTDNLQYLLRGTASGGGQIKADGSVAIKGYFGDNCDKEGQLESSIKMGAITASWSYILKGEAYGFGSLDFDWSNEVVLVPPVFSDD